MNYIINSLLDLDLYKLTMGQFVFHRYPNVPVSYKLINRTKGVHLGRFITENDLRAELNHVENLRFGREDVEYLQRIKVDGKTIFSRDYLNFLSSLRMSPYYLKRVGEDYEIEFRGQWAETIYWETLALSIVNELYYRSLMNYLSQSGKTAIENCGIVTAVNKFEKLKSHPEVFFSDFGTRRRFSRDWHERIVATAIEQIPIQFIGTSNVFLARKYDLQPIGTMAHELFMVMPNLTNGTDEAIRNSHNHVYDEWCDEYNGSLSIALTDTYGSDYVFKSFGVKRVARYKGFRQDSGDPIVFGEKVIEFYHLHYVDPRNKLIVFSDGLDVEAMIRIADRFRGRIKIAFGWGTNLTNDFGFKPVSLVVKVTKANGKGTVKLSDNLAKAMGCYEDVERYKKIFGYTNINYEECKY